LNKLLALEGTEEFSRISLWLQILTLELVMVTVVLVIVFVLVLVYIDLPSFLFEYHDDYLTYSLFAFVGSFSHLVL
jgi:hypothetical protein